MSEGLTCGDSGAGYMPGDIERGRFVSLSQKLRRTRDKIQSAVRAANNRRLMRLRSQYTALKNRSILERALCSAGPVVASQVIAKKVTLTSSAFKHRATIPSQYSCWSNGSRNPGSGKSPPLTWSQIPANADRLALLVYDQAKVVHWFMLIDKRSSWFKTGLPSDVPNEQNRDIKNSEQVVNGFKIKGYSGPCPSAGSTGQYSFELLALKGAKGNSFGKNATAIKIGLRKFTVSSASLTGNFRGGATSTTPTPAAAETSPTPTPTITNTATATPTYTPVPPTSTPTVTPTITPTPTITNTPTVTPTWTTGPISNALSVSAGANTSCALLSDGTMRCWGDNQFGQIGDNTTTERNIGTSVQGLSSGVTAIPSGTSESEHTCAITTEGALKCWGSNRRGQVGDGTTGNNTDVNNRLLPVNVQTLSSGVAQVALGWRHTCALTSSGGAKCWGRNAVGQLGDNTQTDRLTPIDVDGLTSDISQVGTGWTHSCALLTSGAVKCWGANTFGELGDNSTTLRKSPVAVSGLSSGVSQIAVGGYHTCALISDGTVRCWGYNFYGQLGSGNNTDSTTPVTVSSLDSTAVYITAGKYHTCAVLDTGAVQCWGENGSGRLGDTTTTNRNVPTDVNALSSGVEKVAAGAEHTCALLTNGEVKCWGSNSYGQLGKGSAGSSLSPVNAQTQ